MLLLCAAELTTACTLSPGWKGVLGTNVNVLPFTVAVPAFFPPAKKLYTRKDCSVAVVVFSGSLKVATTFVVRGTAMRLLGGVVFVTLNT